MNPEELRMIIELVGGLTDDALWGLGMYLVMQVLSMLSMFVIAIVFILAGYKLINKSIEGSGSSQAWLRNIRDNMGVGVPGPVTAHEFDQMMRWIKDRQ